MKRLLLFFFFCCLLLEAVASPMLFHGSWRWRNDDGSETSATWKGAEKEEIKVSNVNETIRLRIKVNTSAGSNSPSSDNVSIDNRLSYSRNPEGPFTKITSTSTSGEHFVMASGAFVPEGSPTTQQLVLNDGEVFRAGQVITSATPSGSLVFNNESYVKEFEWVLKPTTSVVEGKYYFRVDGIESFEVKPFLTFLADTEAPSIKIKNITVALDANGNATVVPLDFDNGTTDNSGSYTLSFTNSGKICATANENGEVILAAPTGTVITSINFASYGMPDGTCGNFSIGWCHVADSKSIVENLALGKNTVTISASNEVFGDPCGGTVKRLYVEATYGAPAQSITYTCNSLGNQNVTVYATDNSGNTSSEVAEVTIVDNIKPTITAPVAVAVNTDAGKGTASGVVLGNPITADNCSIASTTNDAPSTFPIGNTAVTWTVTDAAGNFATATQTVTVVGMAAPSTPDLLSSSDSGSGNTDNITNDNTPTLEGTALSGATVKLYANGTVVGSTTANSSGAWSVTASTLAEGTYTFTAIAIDGSGSESPASSGLSVTIDTTAPQTTITAGPASVTNAANATFTFTSSETGTFNASVDGSEFTPATSPLSLTGLSEGSHSLQVRAVDVSGNIDATPDTYTWTVDATAPTITGITRSNPMTATTNASTVTYLVAFNEAVTGVDANDFSLTTTGSVTGTISSISGSQKNYQITVSGISGSGNLRLDAKASGTGIKDPAGNVLSTGYSSGEVYTIDTTKPAITSLSVPANSTYRAGQHLDFTVNFDEIVTIGTVDGTPTFGLTIGSTSKEAAYVSGSGSASLIFRYTVQQGEQDMNGIALEVIALNGGTITDAVGNAAVLSLSGMAPSTAGVLVDAIAPTLQTVTIASSNNDITKAKPGDIVTLSLEASKPIALPTVVIAGQPATVTAGSTTAYTATYTLTTADPEGTVSFSITYQDLANNSGTTASSTTNGSSVTFDKTAPVVRAQNITVQLNKSGSATITVAAIVNGSSDNDGIATMTLSKASFDCRNVGTNDVILTVTDLSGNTATATATVTIADLINPTITAPAAVTVNTDTGKSTASNVTLGTPITADNCSGASVTNDAPATFPLGNTTVTWTVTDAAGNKATATQVVTVTDNEKPVPTIATLPTITGECAATVTAPTATDNVAGTVTATTINPTTFTTQGSYSITWTYTDGAGNATTQTQEVIVKDTQAPVVLNIASKTINIPAGFSRNWTMYTHSFVDPLPAGAVVTGITLKYSGRDQNSGGTGQWARMVVSGTHIGSSQYFGYNQDFTINYKGEIPGYVYGGNNYMRMDFDTYPGWTAYFNGGTMTIHYQDAATHAAVLPAVTGECAVTVTTIPKATDNCGGTIVGTTTDLLTYSELGAHTITWSFDDGNGNISTSTQQVIVTDTQKPQVITQNITVELDATGKATITPAMINNGSTDNCSIATDGYSLSKTDFTCAELGVNTVTLTVTDVKGNSETATAIVTIVDPIKPTITAPAAVTVSTDAGKNTASGVALGTPVIIDNCSDVIITNDAAVDFPLGNTTVTWEVTDAAGNKASATQVVTVTDNEKPVPTLATLPTITGQCTAAATAPTATDNVAGTVTGTTSDPTTYTAQGTYTITWTYDDGNGNSSIQTQEVEVKDDTSPIVVTQNLTVQLDATGKATITAAQI
ncbi:HYR domain-containing protein, partial [Pontibacter sp. BT310]